VNNEDRLIARLQGPVGACTWIFGSHDHQRIARQASRLGLDGVELLIDVFHASPDDVRKTYTDAGLALLSLTPENVDLAHVLGARRRSAVAYYERLIGLAAKLECPRVTCHEWIGRVCPPDAPEAEWDRLVSSCRYLAEVADDHDVSLMFEPLRRSLVSQVHDTGDACRLIRTVDHPAMAIVLDTYHLCVDDPNPAAAIRGVGDLVAAVQLADTDRRPLGTGSGRLDDLLAELNGTGFTGPWILECSTQLTGPSLIPRELDPERVGQDIRTSLQWLEGRWAAQGFHRPP
jgi:D-psicose/D-tagatose/L-ribulose 3-epimerase